MVLIKTFHNRGSTIVVEAHGEVLFSAAGDVGRWTKQLTRAIKVATQANAPRNKRPRWTHYGKPLKQTFDADVRYVPSRMRVYGAVGSSALHAAFVDQGTGVFGGNGAYEAKILPPWRRGSPSLYEQGWSPNGSGERSSVLIKGQPGQFFFDAGLAQGFAAMRILSFEAPLTPKISEAVRSLPPGILSFLDQGNTVANPLFKQQLAEWRSWRQAAFNEGRTLGQRKGRRNSRPTRKYVKRPKYRRTAADLEHAREMNRLRQQRYRDRHRSVEDVAPRAKQQVRRTVTEREKEKLNLAAQARRNKNRREREAAEKRAAQQQTRARVLENKAKAYIKAKKAKGKVGTTISLSKMSRANGDIVGYVVTVTTPSGGQTKREFK
jgi:hypothetical protein